MRKKQSRGIRILILFLFPLFTASVLFAQQESRDDELLIRGLIRDGLYEVAADKIFDFVFKYPTHGRREEMLYDISDTLVKEQSYAKALPLLRCYIQEFPQGRWTRSMKLFLARTLVSLDQHAPAIELLGQIIEDSGYRTTDRLDAKEYLAGIFLSQERFEETRALLEDVSPKGTGPRIRLLLANSLRGLQEYQRAETILKNLFSRRRKDDVWREARKDLANLYVEVARYQDCVKMLSGWKPADEESYTESEKNLALKLAISQYHLGDYDLAFSHIEPLIAESIIEDDISTRLPGVLLALQEWSSAVQLLENSFASTQDIFKQRRLAPLLADALINSGMNLKAAEIFEELAGLSGDINIEAYYYVEAAALTEDHDSKKSLIRKAIETADDVNLKSEYSFILTGILSAEGELSETLDILENIVSINPGQSDLVRAKIDIAAIHFKRGKFALATEVLEPLVNDFKHFPEMRRGYPILITSNFLLREWQRAVDIFEIYLKAEKPSRIASDLWAKAGVSASMIEQNARSLRYLENSVLTSTVQTDSDRRLLLLAGNAIKHGELDLAESVFISLSNRGDESIRVSAVAGLTLIHDRKQDWATALQYLSELERAVSDDEVKDWARLKSATFLGKMGRIVEQKAKLREILAGSPSSPFFDVAIEYLQRLALQESDYGAVLQADPSFFINSPVNLYTADRKLAEARRSYFRHRYDVAAGIYAAHPKMDSLPAEHLYFYGRSLYFVGRYSEARSKMSSIDKDNLDTPQAWERERIIAYCYLDEKDYENAYTLMKTLLDTAQTLEQRLLVLQPLGLAADGLDRSPEAEEYLVEYVDGKGTENIENEELVLIAETLVRCGKNSAASEYYRILEGREQNAAARVEYSFRLAELMVFDEDLEAAAEEFLAIAYRNPDLPSWPARSRLRAAQLYLRLNLTEIAERQFQHVARNYPDTEEGIEAARRLIELERRRNQIREEQLQSPTGQ